MYKNPKNGSINWFKHKNQFYFQPFFRPRLTLTRFAFWSRTWVIVKKYGDFVDKNVKKVSKWKKRPVSPKSLSMWTRAKKQNKQTTKSDSLHVRIDRKLWWNDNCYFSLSVRTLCLVMLIISCDYVNSYVRNLCSAII